MRRAAKKAGKATASDEEARELRWYEDSKVSCLTKA